MIVNMFAWFGFFSLILWVMLSVVVNKELKKQLPTKEERAEMVEFGYIKFDEKNKKILRQMTMNYRQQKAILEEAKKLTQKNSVIVEDNNK